MAPVFAMSEALTTLPIGQQVSLPGHFDVRVTLESARPLAKGFECRVRMPDGTLEEAVISVEKAAALSGTAPTADTNPPLANADQLRLLVESVRIRLAYAHDRHFAVSLSGKSKLQPRCRLRLRRYGPSPCPPGTRHRPRNLGPDYRIRWLPRGAFLGLALLSLSPNSV